MAPLHLALLRLENHGLEEPAAQSRGHKDLDKTVIDHTHACIWLSMCLWKYVILKTARTNLHLWYEKKMTEATLLSKNGKLQGDCVVYSSNSKDIGTGLCNQSEKS